MAKKFITSDLISKIEKLTKQRMSEQPVVSLDQFRDAHKKMNPQHILVIEDDETQRLSLKRILEAEGYTTLLAADSAELTAILDEERDVHLILMDIGLPWINGFELAEMMKQHPDLRKLPLVFLSAQAEPEDFARAREVGAADYIKKPFDIEKLKQVVADLLSQPK
ncbi:response regulator [Pseudobdellovibrio exovorus]|uniref:Putative transcriptional regulator PhoB-like protein n=1 Tax=Pseudobdellovibrio exovorus JSS TaxID=1184267 RepID=M4VAL1_9BACT|nr:response regulator [Pseudobdellovibrio exovorus]AGH96442.1 putative transcriptional regulator PhoB-like protein [Pseudobdellovibrio exovorus JSS]